MKLLLGGAMGLMAGWVAWETLALIQRRCAGIVLGQAFGRGRGEFKVVAVPEMLRLLPDFLELLCLGVSAGLSVEQAWSEALDSLPDGEVKRALAGFDRDRRWSRPRSDAFRGVRDRFNDPQIRMTFALIEYALENGNELVNVLSEQAAAIRQRRALELERRVQTAGLRLLIPIFIFILPAVFAILLAPVVISFAGGGTLF